MGGAYGRGGWSVASRPKKNFFFFGREGLHLRPACELSDHGDHLFYFWDLSIIWIRGDKGVAVRASRYDYSGNKCGIMCRSPFQTIMHSRLLLSFGAVI